MAELTKALPLADPDSQPFWTGCQEQRLRAQRCTHCQRFRWPPAGVCPHCHTWEFEWQELSGLGTVTSYVVAHRAFDPAFAEEVPYVIAHVALAGTDNEVVIQSNLEGVDWEQVRVGLTVRVFFAKASPSVSLPKFRPA